MATPDLSADPALVHAWVQGWARARDLPAPTSAYGGWRVDVGLPDQRTRYVFASATAGLSEAAQAIHEPHVHLKVCATPEAVRAVLPAAWLLQPPSFFMDHPALSAANSSSPAGYRVTHARVAAADGVLVRVSTSDGQIAANGTAVFVGSHAVFDRIETHLDHRRRGLGRVVMDHLTRSAIERGAIHGLLVATPDGHALYDTLGWRLRSLYTTAVRQA